MPNLYTRYNQGFELLMADQNDTDMVVRTESVRVATNEVGFVGVAGKQEQEDTLDMFGMDMVEGLLGDQWSDFLTKVDEGMNEEKEA